MNTMTPKELIEGLQSSPQSIELIDVRGTGEYSESHLKEAKNIPLHILPFRMEEIDKTKKVVFLCRSGGRSSQATIFAQNGGIRGYNLAGGMNELEKAFPERIIHGQKPKLFGIF